MIRSIKQHQKFWISFGYWASTFSEGASNILIPLYLYSTGINASKIAVTFMFYEICGLLTNLFSGIIINRWGYKKAFIVSLLLHSIASFGYIFVFTGPLLITAILVNCLRSIRGVAKELINTTCSSFYKHISKSHIDNQFLLGGKDSIKGIGLLVGSFLLTIFSFKFSFILLGCITTFCLFASLLFVNDYRDIKKVSFKGFMHVNRNLKLLSFVRALLYAGRDIWLIIALPLFLAAQGYSTIVIGFVMALGMFIFGFIQPITGFFVKSEIVIGSFQIKQKWRYVNIIFPTAILLSLLPLLVLKTSISWTYLIIIIVLFNLFAGFATAPHNYLHIRLADKDRASRDISFYKTISQLGKVVAALLSGVIFDTIGMNGCLISSSILLLSSAFLSRYINIEK